MRSVKIEKYLLTVGDPLIPARSPTEQRIPPVSPSRLSYRVFNGICLESSAERSVVGLQNFQAYMRLRNTTHTLRASNVTFRFGSVSARIYGSLFVQIPLPGNIFLLFRCHVVEAHIPMVMGLDVMCSFHLSVYFNTHTLSSSDSQWALPLKYTFGRA